MLSPRYIIDPKEGGERKTGKRTNPFRWMIDGFKTIKDRGAEKRLQLEVDLEEDGEKYVGLYLSHDVADSDNSVIKAIYNLFIYDQLNEEHMQKEGQHYFHGTSRDGFCCKVALNKFNSQNSGLLINDCCIFGAEVLEAFGCKLDKEGLIHESLSLKKDLTPRIYTLVFKDISKSKERLFSQVFAAGGYNWKIELSPNISPYKDFLSVYLSMNYSLSLDSGKYVYVDYVLCLLDQRNAKHLKRRERSLFSIMSSGWGWHEFLSWKDLQDPSSGFLHNDTCIIEVTVAVLGEGTFA